MDQKDALVHNRSSPEAKIALFHSLFRGREDVYAGDCPNFRGHRGEAVVDENGTVPFSIREPQDRQIRLSTCLCQPMGFGVV
jgi:hypothetical protein